MLADGSSTEEIGSGAVPEPAHRAQPRPQHPDEAARPDEARGRRHRRTRGIGRPDARHVRSLRRPRRVDRGAGVRPGVRRRLSRLPQRPHRSPQRQRRRNDARSPARWPSSTTRCSATRRRCSAPIGSIPADDRRPRPVRPRARRHHPPVPDVLQPLRRPQPTEPSSAARSRPRRRVDPELRMADADRCRHGGFVGLEDGRRARDTAVHGRDRDGGPNGPFVVPRRSRSTAWRRSSVRWSRPPRTSVDRRRLAERHPVPGSPIDVTSVRTRRRRLVRGAAPVRAPARSSSPTVPTACDGSTPASGSATPSRRRRDRGYPDQGRVRGAGALATRPRRRARHRDLARARGRARLRAPLGDPPHPRARHHDPSDRRRRPVAPVRHATPGDEIGELGRSLDSMADELRGEDRTRSPADGASSKRAKRNASASRATSTTTPSRSCRHT